MYKKILLLLVCSYIFPGKSVAQVEFNNLTILVNSHDKYSDLWDPFYHFLFQNWPSLKTYNKHVPILFISNSKKYNDPRVTPVMIESETSWSDTFLEAVNRVKTDYIMILLEDYIFSQPVNEERLQELFLKMQETGAAYLQISYSDVGYTSGEWTPKIPGTRFVGKHDQFRTALQACIWRKEDLKWILKKGEGIWDFEIAGSTRSEGIQKPFFRTFENSPIAYLNASQEGYLNAGVMRWIRENGGSIEATKLPVNEDHKIRLAFKQLISNVYWKIYKPFISFMRQLVKKLF